MTKPYQLLPGLDPDAYLALKRDIEAHGIQVPIEVDEAGNVLDGHHRLRIAYELGLKDDAIPRVVRARLTEEQKLEHVLRLNLLRRHLTREQKQALALRLRQQGWTTRRIAEVLGVGKSTVADWLGDVSGFGHVDTQSGNHVLPATIIDSKGRAQPATKPHTPKLTEAAKSTEPHQDPVPTPLDLPDGLAPAVRDLIRETPLANRHDELLALARLDPDEQEMVAQAVVNGEFERVADAVAVLREAGHEAEAEPEAGEDVPLSPPHDEASFSAEREPAAPPVLPALPDSPTPKKQAENDPGRRWTKAWHDIWMLINSTRDLGGLQALAVSWDRDTKRLYRDAIRRIKAKLDEWDAWLTREVGEA